MLTVSSENKHCRALRFLVPDWARTLIQMKKSFLEKFKSEKWFCKKSRNLSWVGADGSLKWLKSWKNLWNFGFVEIWSSCRCDMKIIFGAFNNLDIKLLSHRKFFHHMYYRFLQKALKLKNAKKIAKKFFEKSSNPHSLRDNSILMRALCVVMNSKNIFCWIQ